MINRAQYQYIRDVLGVSEVLVPDGFVAKQPDIASAPEAESVETVSLVEILKHTDSPVAILSNKALSTAETELALKILKAVKIQNPAIVQIGSWNPETVSLLQQSLFARKFIYFEQHFEKYYGTTENTGDSQVLYTYALDLMLNGDVGDIQAFKKHVWQHMKLFSAQWGKL